MRVLDLFSGIGGMSLGLVTGTFEAGEYERPNSYSPKGWRKVLEQRF